LAEKVKFQAIKGVRDILPPDSALWNRVEQAAREVFGTFGFSEIRLPIFEPTDLFARSIGLNTDVVSKEMYVFEDHDLRWLDLLRSNTIEAIKNVLVSPENGARDLVSTLNSFWASASDQMAKVNLPRTPSNAIA
jgi:histidyl-tRNA synthetase